MTATEPGVMDKRGVLLGRIPGRSDYGPHEGPKVFIRTIAHETATLAKAADLAAHSVEFGDIFSTGAEAIVSAANGVGHMNGGVDLRIRDRFSVSRIEERVRETIVERYQGELPIGQTFTIRTRLPDLPVRAGDPDWLIVSPTMTQPRAMGPKQIKDAVYVATLAALVAARNIGAEAVALTTMGAGVGAGAHTDRGARISGMEAAIAGMDRALLDFQDIVHQLVSPEQAFAEYRSEK
jgi:O-acetyl-ADP-ribose deacetylase (regulator of RNase III)